MMKGLALLCVLALASSVSCSSDTNEFAVSIPEGFFAGFFNRIIFPLLGDWAHGLGNNFPNECCYKKSALRLQITNLTERGLTADTVVSSSSTGISVVADMGVEWDFHFKLCTQVGKTCTPILFCNDDVELQFTIKLASLMEASATNDGALNLTSSDATLELDVSYGDLCATAKGIIAEVVADVNKELGLLFPKLSNALLGAIGNALTLNLQIGDANVQVVYSDSETGTTNTGLVAGGSIPVTNVKTGAKGTFTPETPLPDLLTNTQPNGQEELFVSDSVPNNILQALFNGTIPDHFQLDILLQGNLFKIHANLKEAPQVSFTEQGDSIVIKTREVVQNGLLRVDFDVNTRIFFSFGHNQNKLFLELNPDNFVFEVEILPPLDPLHNVSAEIDQLVEAQWNKYIPVLNNFLAAHPIPLPPFPFFDFPGAVNFDGYVKLFIQNKPRDDEVIEEEVSFSALANYPRTVAALNGMVHGLSGPARKFFIEFGEKLAEALDDVSVQNVREERSIPVHKNGKKGFYCPSIIPGFSIDDCPDQ